MKIQRRARGTRATATSPRAGSTTGASARYDGSWGLSYMRECDGQRFIPAVQYYQMNGEAGGGESAFLQKVQNATTMRGYFGDFKLLMQRAKDFGKPVIVLLEADGFGFLRAADRRQQRRLRRDQGQRRRRAGGPAQHRRGLGAGVPAAAQVGRREQRRARHPHLRLGERQGRRVRLGDRSARRPRSTRSTTSWRRSASPRTSPARRGTSWSAIRWTATPTTTCSCRGRTAGGMPATAPRSARRASTATRSGCASGTSKAAKRWILWQIPLGNSNHRNVANDGSARAGYKDNRPEYFFGNGTAHMAKFADAGVIGLLFGAGAGGQSSYQNDNYTDGQLFMKSRAGAILSAGGVTLATGGRHGQRRRDGQRGHDGQWRHDGDGGRGTTGTGRHDRRRRARRRRAVQLRVRARRAGRSRARRSPARPARRRAPSRARTRSPSASAAVAPRPSRCRRRRLAPARWSRSISGFRQAAESRRCNRSRSRVRPATGPGPAAGEQSRR